MAKAKHLPVGDPLGQVALGPVISRAQVERIHSIVKDSVAAGAKLAAGGTFDGPFYRPTVLTGVKPGMRAFDEEVFIFGGVVGGVTFCAAAGVTVPNAHASTRAATSRVRTPSVLLGR